MLVCMHFKLQTTGTLGSLLSQRLARADLSLGKGALAAKVCIGRGGEEPADRAKSAKPSRGI